MLIELLGMIEGLLNAVLGLVADFLSVVLGIDVEWNPVDL